jgi:hypothetical protein
MTLMNGLTLGDRALLWSDTCWWDVRARKVAAYAPKAFETLLMPGVVAMTTVGGIPYQIPEIVGAQSPTKLGDLLEACELAAREFVKVQPEVAFVRLLVAGWCYETDSARLFMVASETAPNWRPFEAAELGWYIGAGIQTPEAQAAIAEGLTPDKIRLLCDLQRTLPFAPDKGGIAPFRNIGGELIECELTRDGVQSRVIKELGEPSQDREAA